MRLKGLALWALLAVLVLSAITFLPLTTLAGSQSVGYLQFVSNSDNNLILGETSTINFRLLDIYGVAFSGTATATLIDPSGVETTYPISGQSPFSINNVTLDSSGTYRLVVTDGSGNVVSGNIQVQPAKIIVSGSLMLNYNNNLTLTLMDSNGKPLPRRSVTIDASQVGLTAATYTTLYDGTISFSMTPTTMGTVSVTHGGHVVGTINVVPAFVSGTRIGSQSQNNATLSTLVAQQGWNRSDNVILTRDDVVADAMVAAPLSKKLDAPILMTPSGSLDNGVLNEINSLQAKTVYIIGGTGVVSENIEQTLKSKGLNIVRFDGVDRYDTAAKIAMWLNSPGTVYLAYGYGEPDALAAGALAAEQGIPILLTDKDSLQDSTQKELTSLKPKTVVLLGGTGVISSGLEAQLAGQYSVRRWGGVDRYATEQIIFQNFFNQKPASNQFPLYIASSYVSPSDVSSGNPYGDALLTAALAAKKNGFVITLPPNSLPNPISTFLLFNKGYIPSATVVGNSSAISYNLEQLLQQGLTH